MMVYEQITLFIKNRTFPKICFGSNIDFLIGKSVSRLEKPEKTNKNTGEIAKLGSADGAKPLVFEIWEK